jgi:hypothetical protein
MTRQSIKNDPTIYQKCAYGNKTKKVDLKIGFRKTCSHRSFSRYTSRIKDRGFDPDVEATDVGSVAASKTLNAGDAGVASQSGVDFSESVFWPKSFRTFFKSLNLKLIIIHHNSRHIQIKILFFLWRKSASIVFRAKNVNCVGEKN